MEKIAIAGSLGLLGQRLLHSTPDNKELLCIDLPESPQPLTQPNYVSCDLTDRGKTFDVLDAFSPDWIINCAAYTHVDRAEVERELCWTVNVEAAENLAYAARKTRSRILQISSDYIFDGKNGPYTEDATPNPLGYYGKSKLAAENVLRGAPVESTIIRTMVLYGTSKNQRPDFVQWLIGELKAGRRVKIVNDQIGNATLNDNLAENIWRVIEQRYTGILNIAGKEINSRLEFARQICEVFDLDLRLMTAISTPELGQKAPRPLNSGLVVDKAITELGLLLLDNRESLRILKDHLNL
ncbi:MAG: NAD(P)-dependent oxidoreductase [candidate division KSB1 bacterium]|nr:NAD(P)-dependent oxidoreductase [candidate division KSB1 bacterium]